MTAVVERNGAANAQRVARPSALVVVADPRVRAEVAARLRALGASDVIEAGTVADARRLARQGEPRGLAVLDLALPDGSGLRLLAELRSSGIARTVVLAPSDDPHAVRAALVSGVRGYLAGASRPRHLAALPDGSAPRPRTGPDCLSAREIEVLRLVADGQSNRDVGEALGLSALTVKSHLARIGRKLGSGDRAEMVALAMRAGILS